LQADDKGTVVIAAVQQEGAQAGAVYATVRDPGRSFSRQLELRSSDPPGSALAQLRRVPTISTIAADGTVAVSWPESTGNDATAQQTSTATSVRRGRARRFARAVPGPVVATYRPESIERTDRGRPIRVAAGLTALCRRIGCRAPTLFTWGSRTQLIVFNSTGVGLDGSKIVDSNPAWYVARRGAGGAFSDPVVAYHGQGFRVRPLWTAKAGVIDFVRATEPDYAGHGAAVFVMPFGPFKRRLVPRISVGRDIEVANGKLSLTAWCATACHLTGSFQALRGTAATGPTYAATLIGEDARASSHSIARLLDPLERGRLTAVSPETMAPGTTRVRMVLTARDARGRTARLTTTLRFVSQDGLGGFQAWEVER